jgi:type II secretion system protein J
MYDWNDHSLWRVTWPVLDQSPETKPLAHRLLNNVSDAKFEYLDGKGRFREEWPSGEESEPLPRGVKIELHLPQGSISQFYLIPVRVVKSNAPSLSSAEPDDKKKETKHD